MALSISDLDLKDDSTLIFAPDMTFFSRLVFPVFCIVAFAWQAHGEPAKMIPAECVDWNEIYQPASKVPTEIQVGSALRKELFKLLRAKVTPETHFSGSLKAYRNWAIFSGRTVDESGKSIKHPPLDNDDAVALWLRTQDGWSLVAHSFGHSDQFYLIWPEQYGVPRELLGMDASGPEGKE